MRHVPGRLGCFENSSGRQLCVHWSQVFACSSKKSTGDLSIFASMFFFVAVTRSIRELDTKNETNALFAKPEISFNSIYKLCLSVSWSLV